METAGVRYIESSALVAALLEHDSDALKSVRTQGTEGHFVGSTAFGCITVPCRADKTEIPVQSPHARLRL